MDADREAARPHASPSSVAVGVGACSAIAVYKLAVEPSLKRQSDAYGWVLATLAFGHHRQERGRAVFWSTDDFRFSSPLGDSRPLSSPQAAVTAGLESTRRRSLIIVVSLAIVAAFELVPAAHRVSARPFRR